MSDSNTTIWPAPTTRQPLDATVEIPGSKSLSNRYLILAALGTQPVRLVGLLRSRDTELMMNALRTLGVRCDVARAIRHYGDGNATGKRSLPWQYEGVLRPGGHGDAFCAWGLRCSPTAPSNLMVMNRHTPDRCSRFWMVLHNWVPSSNITARMGACRSP